MNDAENQEDRGDCASRTGALLAAGAAPGASQEAVSAHPGDGPTIAMPAATLAALQGSIAKWEAIVAGTGEDNGATNCPLCACFYDWSDNCQGCPVAAVTGDGDCGGTPYDKWMNHLGNVHDRWGFPRTPEPGCTECARNAQAELDFLRSLLPASALEAASAGETRQGLDPKGDIAAARSAETPTLPRSGGQ